MYGKSLSIWHPSKHLENFRNFFPREAKYFNFGFSFRKEFLDFLLSPKSLIENSSLPIRHACGTQPPCIKTKHASLLYRASKRRKNSVRARKYLDLSQKFQRRLTSRVKKTKQTRLGTRQLGIGDSVCHASLICRASKRRKSLCVLENVSAYHRNFGGD